MEKRPFLFWLLIILSILLAGWLWPRSVTVTWRTESETDSAGFYLFRETVCQGCTTAPLQLTNDLINSQGNSFSGATYQFVDRSVEAGQAYRYFLEEVGLDGTAVQHTAFQQTHTVPLIPPTTLYLAIAIAIIGIWRHTNKPAPTTHNSQLNTHNSTLTTQKDNA